jgi:glucosamine 6-phosphate synthetase-like amidotransferase/phosphosugar isomerase protein
MQYLPDFGQNCGPSSVRSWKILAYRVALARGTEIDQPRNLAKSVTVE